MVSALTEMYVQGVSTTKVKAITQGALRSPLLYVGHQSRTCGKAASSVPNAVFIAISMNQEGYRQVSGVQFAGRESQRSRRDCLACLLDPGRDGVEWVVFDAA